MSVRDLQQDPASDDSRTERFEPGRLRTDLLFDSKMDDWDEIC